MCTLIQVLKRRYFRTTNRAKLINSQKKSREEDLGCGRMETDSVFE